MSRVVVCGAPGSGKSTWVEAHAAAGDIVFDWDRLVGVFTGLSGHTYAPDLIGLFSDIREAFVRSVRAGKVRRPVYVIVADETQARRIASLIGARLVRLTVDEAERRRRLAERVVAEATV